MNTLYLIRHGENPANLTNEFSHRLVDYPLTPKGVVQAQQTAEHFRRRRVDAIYTSPLRRAIETAEIIGAATGHTPIVVEYFREVNVGALERDPSDANWDLHDSIVRAWLTGQPDLRFPEGEDYHSLLGRMRQGVAAALDQRHGQHVLVVGHGGIFTFMLKDICHNVDLYALMHQPSRNCSITEMTMERGELGWLGTLKAWSDHSHLSGAAVATIIGHPTIDRR